MDTTSQAAESHNRVVLNRVVLNSLTAASLASTTISQNTLVGDNTMEFNTAYEPSAAPGTMLHETEEGRDVLEYIVRCAFSPETTVTVDHDGQTFEFLGGLALAEAWSTRALNGQEESLMAACLYAHVNHFGTSVPISIRIPGTAVGADAAEAAAFPVLEGAFMGKYFVGDSADMELYACQGDSYDVAIVNSDDRDLRVCTDASVNSGFTVVGRCREVCDDYVPGYGWQNCWANGVQYSAVANVFLSASDLDGVDATCPVGASCVPGVAGGALDSGDSHSAVLSGNGAAAVQARCGQDSVCIVNGVAAGAVTANADLNAIAEINCAHAQSCAVDAAAGASVEINCRDAGTCTNVTCQPGAQCLLQCGDSQSCGFATCDAGVTSCGVGTLACGASCT